MSVKPAPGRRLRAAALVPLLFATCSEAREPAGVPAIAGQVLDENGRAVEGATVFVRPERPGGSKELVLWKDGFTRDDGRFTFQDLEPGRYRLWVEHSEFELAERVVELAEGASLNLEIDLGHRLASLTVSGRVVGPAGQGVGDVTVRYTATGDRGPYYPYLQDLRRPPIARASPDGSFQLQVPRPGTYTLEARHAPFAAGRVEVEVAAGGLEGVVLELARGAALSGRIFGLAPGEEGRVRVSARHQRTGRRCGPARVSDGNYRIEGLVAGPWTVEADVAGRRARGEAVVGGPGDEVHLDLEFLQGFRLQGVVRLDGEPLAGAGVNVICAARFRAGQLSTANGGFSIERVPPGRCELLIVAGRSFALPVRRELEVMGDEELAIEIETASMAGTVLDATTGRPLPGARLELFPEGSSGSFWDTASTSSDAAGRFAFPRLAAGSWTFAATAGGYAREKRAVTVAGHLEIEQLQLRATTPLVLEIRTATGEVPFRVWLTLRERTSGALVEQEGFDPDRWGYVELGHVPPGRYRLRVQGAGEKVELDVEHPSAEPIPVSLGGPRPD